MMTKNPLWDCKISAVVRTNTLPNKTVICCCYMLFCFVFQKGEENLFLGNYSFACFFSDWKGSFYKACNAEVINWEKKKPHTKKNMKTWICTLENWWAENGRKETIQV